MMRKNAATASAQKMKSAESKSANRFAAQKSVPMTNYAMKINVFNHAAANSAAWMKPALKTNACITATAAVSNVKRLKSATIISAVSPETATEPPAQTMRHATKAYAACPETAAD
jgi:hypothetical protein